MTNKKIYRRIDNVIIAGVCGGLADYFKIDEILVRIIFVALTIWGGSGVLIYLILWLLIPKESQKNKKYNLENSVKEFAQDIDNKAKTVAKEIKKEIKVKKIKPEKRQKSFLGLVLILWGVILLINKLAPRLIEWDYLGPGILIVLGGYLVFQK